MNEQMYEKELDMKKILFRALRNWRKMACIAIIIGILIGVGKYVISVVKINDPDYLAAVKNNYEVELAGYEATGVLLENEIENLNENRVRQTEYNEKSVMMKINPMLEYKATMNLYIDTEYQIMPDKSYQDIDLSARAVQTYYRYVTGGEMYQYLLENLPYEIELRYLQELISASVDYSTSMIYLVVTHVDEASCNEMMNIIYQGILSEKALVQESITEHEIYTTNNVAYSLVDFALDEVQKQNLQYISNIDTALQEKNELLQEWKKEPKPTYEYTLFELFKEAVKFALIAIVLIGVVLMVLAAIGYILSSKLQDADDMKNRYGLRLIGEVARENKNKRFLIFDRLFARWGGIVVQADEQKQRIKAISSSIRVELESEQDRKETKPVKIAFAGTIGTDEIGKLIEMISLGSRYTVLNAGDMVTSSESIEKASAADYVIIVEKQECSVQSQIERELEQLSVWKKKILGAIVTNVDVIP